MAAKERHKQKVKQRLCDKLESICLLEETLNLTIHKYVQQASTRAADLLALEDTDLFMKEYGSVELLLDRVNNTCELLYTSAEDMIGQLEDMSSASQAVVTTITPENDAYLKCKAEQTSVPEKSMDLKCKLEKPSTPEKDAVVKCKLEKTSTHEKDAVVKCKLEKTSTHEKDAVVKCKLEKPSTHEKDAVVKCHTEKPSTPEEDIQLRQKSNNTANPLQDDGGEKSGSRTYRAASPQDKIIKKELLAMLDVTKMKQDKTDTILKPFSKQNSEGELKASQVITKTKPPKFPQDNSLRSSSESNIKHTSPHIPKAVKQMMACRSEQNKGASFRQAVHSQETSASVITTNSQVYSKGLPPRTSSNAWDSSLETCSGNEDLNKEDLTNSTAVNAETIQDHITTDKGDGLEEDIPKDISATNACNSVGSIVEPSTARDRDLNENAPLNCMATNVHSVETVQYRQSFDSTNDGIQGTARDMVQTDSLTIKQSCLPPGKITPVIVSDTFSPWCFSVQANPREVNLLMEQICTHMSKSGLQEPPLSNPHQGQMCLAKFSKDVAFYRAYIMSCSEANREVEVLYVDYGNREKVKYSHLRQLPQQFYEFPMQAICCSLAEVMPSNKYMLWTEEDCMVFKHFVLNQQMNCIQACRCSSPGIPVIVRLFTNFPGTSMVVNPISIGAVLVERGLAKFVSTVDQIVYIEKSGEGKEESLILNKDIDGGNLVELHDYEQHRQPPCSVSETAVKVHGNTSGQHTVKAEAIATKPETETHEINAGRGHTVEGDHTVPKGNECDSNMIKGGNFDSKLQKGDNCDSTMLKGDGQTRNSDKTYQINEPTNSGDNKRGSDTAKIDDDRSTKAIRTKLNRDSPKEAKETLDADKAKDVVITDNNNPDDEKQKEQATMESETHSIVTTSNLDSENSTDTGFHSSDVNFDLKMDPQGQEVMLSHVHSPTLFYVHTLQVGRTMDRLMKSLNGRFEKMNRRKLTKLSQTFMPCVGDLCCAQFLQDNCFYRASILKIRSDSEPTGTGKFRVHYIDFGDEEWLPKRRLFPLPPQYSSLPPLAVRCKLVYIKPSTNEGSVDTVRGDYKWSDSSTKAFIDLMGFEKTLHMQVVEGHLSSGCKGDLIGTKDETLGVYLVDTTGDHEVCANLDLIKQGYAILDGLDTVNLNEASPNNVSRDSSYPYSLKQFDTSELTTNEELNNWNPMEEDYLSKRNTYQLDTEDAEMATVGYKSGTNKGVCRYFSKGAHCWSGENCPYRHVQSDSAVPLERKEVYCVDNQLDALPEVYSWVAAKIMTILTPGHFYVLLPLGKKSLDETSTASGQNGCPAESHADITVSCHYDITINFNINTIPENADPACTETLDDLQLALNEEYSKKSPHDRSLQLNAPGEIVVARFSQDKQWYRARVIEVSEDQVKVFYVDFGNREWLPDEEVAEITPEFLHLPFQALECFLHNVEPAGDENWTQEARKAFRDLVDGKTLVAHIRSRSWNGSLSVDLYDTSEDTDVNVAGKMIEDNHAVVSRFHTDSSCNGSVSGQSRQSNSEQSEVIFLPG